MNHVEGGDWSKSSAEGHWQICLWAQAYSPLRLGLLLFSGFCLQIAPHILHLFVGPTLALCLLFRNYPRTTAKRASLLLCH